VPSGSLVWTTSKAPRREARRTSRIRSGASKVEGRLLNAQQRGTCEPVIFSRFHRGAAFALWKERRGRSVGWLGRDPPPHTGSVRGSHPRFVSGTKLSQSAWRNDVERRSIRRGEEAEMGLPGLIRTAVLLGLGTLWLLVA
jgi:hypothetical protein